MKSCRASEPDCQMYFLPHRIFPSGLKTTCDLCCVLLESALLCIHGLPHVNALCFCSMLLSGDFFRDQSSHIKAVVKEQRSISCY